MPKHYEVPELIIVGEANEVVMGVGTGGYDGLYDQAAPDFEFEQD